MRVYADKGSLTDTDFMNLISFTIISEDGVVNLSKTGEESGSRDIKH